MPKKASKTKQESLKPIRTGRVETRSSSVDGGPRQGNTTPSSVTRQRGKSSTPRGNRKDGTHSAVTPRGASPRISAQKRKVMYDPTTSELERKRLQVAGELHKVEQQILDLETKYLEQSTAFGNAIRGYEGFLGGIGQAKNKNVPVKEEDRIFSMGMALK